jgi:Cd2+/Zn2+-exporting ATPase
MSDLTEELTAIGLTEYEAKVYLALLQEHPATGYQLSKLSGVPRSMVYEALKRLHGRGAALEAIEGRTTLYRPLPPETLLAQHEAEYKRLVSDLHEGLSALYTQTPDDRVWSLSGRETILAYARQMLHEAEHDLYLVLTDEDLEALRIEIEAACARNLNISILLTGAATIDCGRVARHPPLESELQEVTGLLLIAVEMGEVLVASGGPPRKKTATVTRNADLGLIARQFVWMELFTQRIYKQLGPELLARLEPEDRKIFESSGT